ncbi:MAG TPA: serine/threonine-protein kinase, partial [Actinomycetota bacterium]|nr:serine/threonine-protein kinase [Actinomycetota bacterium]
MSTEAGPPGSVAPGVPLGSHYLVFELVGAGATGAVYRGSERDGGPDLAVKILRPELASDPEVVTRFVRERSILLSVTHPNLVTVHDLVMEGSTLAIVMDFVRGGDLRSYLRQSGPLPPSAAAQLVAQVLNALGAVHARGIVHRDLKPENVMVDVSNPAAPVARLTDFGIARIAHGPSFTRLSGLLGTPEYMAPEQADRDECGPAADLYAAGILFYELVCGTTPFAGGHPVAVIRAHIDEAPRRPTGMSDTLWAIVGRLLAKSPEDRPATAAQAAVELRAAAISATRPLPPQPQPQPRPEPQTVRPE